MNGFGENFGQKVDLTTRIKEILREYPQGTSILKEFVQNADDAGADTLIFCLDCRSHLCREDLAHGLKGMLGPALLVYNSATFSDEDFKSICSIGNSGKASQSTKTGRFGIGFNSTYHITDVPSFVSRDRVAFFDPHACNLPGVDASNPGKIVNFIQNKEVLEHFKDIFESYKILGCTLQEEYPATLFRLPLRTPNQAAESRLSSACFSTDSIIELLTSLSAEADSCLLFLKSVCRIGACIVNDGAKNPKWLWRREIHRGIENLIAERQHVLASMSSFALARDHCFRDMGSSFDVPCDTRSVCISIEPTWQPSGFNIQGLPDSGIASRAIQYVLSLSVGGPESCKLSLQAKSWGMNLIALGGSAISLDMDGCLLLESPTTCNRTFCFLPLPVNTRFCFAVHGSFELFSNRRDIWRGQDMTGEGRLKSMWNSCIGSECVATAVSSCISLACSKFACVSPLNLLPYDTDDLVFKEITLNTIRNLISAPIFKARNGKLLSLESLCIIPHGMGPQLRLLFRTLFDHLELDYAEIPSNLIKACAEAKIDIRLLNQDTLASIIASAGCSMQGCAISPSNMFVILKFLLEDLESPGSSITASSLSRVQGLYCLPSISGRVVQFPCPSLVCNSTTVLVNSIDQASLLEAACGSEFSIVFCDDSALFSMLSCDMICESGLKVICPDIFSECIRLICTSSVPSSSWIALLWKYLGSVSIDWIRSLIGLPIVPCQSDEFKVCCLQAVENSSVISPFSYASPEIVEIVSSASTIGVYFANLELCSCATHYCGSFFREPQTIPVLQACFQEQSVESVICALSTCSLHILKYIRSHMIQHFQATESSGSETHLISTFLALKCHPCGQTSEHCNIKVGAEFVAVLPPESVHSDLLSNKFLNVADSAGDEQVYLKLGVPRMNVSEFVRGIISNFPELSHISQVKFFAWLENSNVWEDVQSDSIVHWMKNQKFVPTNTVGSASQAHQLLDPSQSVLISVMQGCNRFPAAHLRDPICIDVLRRLGLRQTLDLQDISEAVSVIAHDETDFGRQQTRAGLVFEYLDSHSERLLGSISGVNNDQPEQNAYLSRILREEWIPRDLRPIIGDVPFFRPQDKLCALANARPRDELAVCFTQCPVSLFIANSTKLKQTLGWHKGPPGSAVAKHLLALVDAWQVDNRPIEWTQSLRGICHKIYSKLNDALSQDDVCWIHSLSDRECIWNGSSFLKPQTLAIESPINAEPLLSQLPSDLQQLCNLAIKLGVKQNFAAHDYANALLQLKESHESDPLSTEWLKNSIGMVVRATQVEGDLFNEVVFCPDENGVLHNSQQLVYNDAQWMHADDLIPPGILFCHPDISWEVASRIGISSLRMTMLGQNVTSIGIGEAFGQSQSITTTLQNILQQYPEGPGIFHEMLQNADDAGASEMRIVVSKKRWATQSLLKSEMSELQGPAIYIYNDEMFDPGDFKSLANVGQGSKKKSAFKTGKFGLGFNAVYHITDVPSVVSGDCTVFFDPHTNYVPDAKPSEPGIKINHVRACAKKHFSDQFAPFELFECNMEKSFKGTLFRFPLRTAEASKHSLLKSEECSMTHCESMIQAFISELETSILFLRNVHTVSVFTLNDLDDQPVKKHVVSKRVQLLGGSKADISKQIMHPGEKMITPRVLLDRLSQAPSYPSSEVQCTIHCQCYDDGKVSHSSESQWVVAQAAGSDKTVQFSKSHLQHESLRLIPIGGVAACVSSSVPTSLEGNRYQSKAFCGLPLPLSTGLPVIVNGAFELTVNRRDVWYGDGLSGEGQIRADWNVLLVQDLLPILYIRVMETIATQSSPLLATDSYNKLWPIRGNSSIWASLIGAFYSCCASRTIFPTLTQSFVRGSGAVVIPQESDCKQISQILEHRGVVGVYLPHEVSELCLKHGCVNRLSIEFLAQLFNSEAIPRPSTYDEAVSILNICLGDEEALFSYFIKIPCIPLQNGKIISLKEAPDIVVLSDTASKHLFQDCPFPYILDTRLFLDDVKKLQDMHRDYYNGKDWLASSSEGPFIPFQLQQLSPESFKTLVSNSLGAGSLQHRELLNVEDRTLQWIIQILNFCKSRSLEWIESLSGVAILPTASNSLVRASSHCKIVMPSFQGIPDVLHEKLTTSCGLRVLSSLCDKSHETTIGVYLAPVSYAMFVSLLSVCDWNTEKCSHLLQFHVGDQAQVFEESGTDLRRILLKQAVAASLESVDGSLVLALKIHRLCGNMNAVSLDPSIHFMSSSPFPSDWLSGSSFVSASEHERTWYCQLGIRTLPDDEVLVKHILLQLSDIKPNQQIHITKAVLDRFSSWTFDHTEELSEMEFVPNNRGRLFAPNGLYDPAVLELQGLLLQDEEFPDVTLRSSEHLQVLRQLGLLQVLSMASILTVANRINASQDAALGMKLLKYLDAHFDELDASPQQLEDLKCIAWLPCTDIATKFPHLPYPERKKVLCEPAVARPVKDIHLCSCHGTIVEAEIHNSGLSQIFGWSSIPKMTVIAHQLDEVIKKASGAENVSCTYSQVETTCACIFSALGQHYGDNENMQALFPIFENRPIVPVKDVWSENASAHFVLPARACEQCHFNPAPFLHIIPACFADSHSIKFLRGMGLSASFGPQDFAIGMDDFYRQFQSKPLNQIHALVACRIVLNYFSDLYAADYSEPNLLSNAFADASPRSTSTPLIRSSNSSSDVDDSVVFNTLDVAHRQVEILLADKELILDLDRSMEEPFILVDERNGLVKSNVAMLDDGHWMVSEIRQQKSHRFTHVLLPAQIVMKLGCLNAEALMSQGLSDMQARHCIDMDSLNEKILTKGCGFIGIWNEVVEAADCYNCKDVEIQLDMREFASTRLFQTSLSCLQSKCVMIRIRGMAPDFRDAALNSFLGITPNLDMLNPKSGAGLLSLFRLGDIASIVVNGRFWVISPSGSFVRQAGSSSSGRVTARQSTGEAVSVLMDADTIQRCSDQFEPFKDLYRNPQDPSESKLGGNFGDASDMIIRIPIRTLDRAALSQFKSRDHFQEWDCDAVIRSLSFFSAQVAPCISIGASIQGVEVSILYPGMTPEDYANKLLCVDMDPVQHVRQDLENRWLFYNRTDWRSNPIASSISSLFRTSDPSELFMLFRMHIRIGEVNIVELLSPLGLKESGSTVSVLKAGGGSLSFPLKRHQASILWAVGTFTQKGSSKARDLASEQMYRPWRPCAIAAAPLCMSGHKQLWPSPKHSGFMAHFPSQTHKLFPAASIEKTNLPCFVSSWFETSKKPFGREIGFATSDLEREIPDFEWNESLLDVCASAVVCILKHLPASSRCPSVWHHPFKLNFGSLHGAFGSKLREQLSKAVPNMKFPTFSSRSSSYRATTSANPAMHAAVQVSLSQGFFAPCKLSNHVKLLLSSCAPIFDSHDCVRDLLIQSGARVNLLKPTKLREASSSQKGLVAVKCCEIPILQLPKALNGLLHFLLTGADRETLGQLRGWPCAAIGEGEIVELGSKPVLVAQSRENLSGILQAAGLTAGVAHEHCRSSLLRVCRIDPNRAKELQILEMHPESLAQVFSHILPHEWEGKLTVEADPSVMLPPASWFLLATKFASNYPAGSWNSQRSAFNWPILMADNGRFVRLDLRKKAVSMQQILTCFPNETDLALASFRACGSIIIDDEFAIPLQHSSTDGDESSHLVDMHFDGESDDHSDSDSSTSSSDDSGRESIVEIGSSENAVYPAAAMREHLSVEELRVELVQRILQGLAATDTDQDTMQFIPEAQKRFILKIVLEALQSLPSGSNGIDISLRTAVMRLHIFESQSPGATALLPAMRQNSTLLFRCPPELSNTVSQPYLLSESAIMQRIADLLEIKLLDEVGVMERTMLNQWNDLTSSQQDVVVSRISRWWTSIRSSHLLSQLSSLPFVSIVNTEQRRTPRQLISRNNPLSDVFQGMPVFPSDHFGQENWPAILNQLGLQVAVDSALAAQACDAVCSRFENCCGTLPTFSSTVDGGDRYLIDEQADSIALWNAAVCLASYLSQNTSISVPDIKNLRIMPCSLPKLTPADNNGTDAICFVRSLCSPSECALHAHSNLCFLSSPTVATAIPMTQGAAEVFGIATGLPIAKVIDHFRLLPIYSSPWVWTVSQYEVYSEVLKYVIDEWDNMSEIHRSEFKTLPVIPVPGGVTTCDRVFQHIPDADRVQPLLWEVPRRFLQFAAGLELLGCHSAPRLSHICQATKSFSSSSSGRRLNPNELLAAINILKLVYRCDDIQELDKFELYGPTEVGSLSAIKPLLCADDPLYKQTIDMPSIMIHRDVPKYVCDVIGISRLSHVVVERLCIYTSALEPKSWKCHLPEDAAKSCGELRDRILSTVRSSNFMRMVTQQLGSNYSSDKLNAVSSWHIEIANDLETSISMTMSEAALSPSAVPFTFDVAQGRTVLYLCCGKDPANMPWRLAESLSLAVMRHLGWPDVDIGATAFFLLRSITRIDEWDGWQGIGFSHGISATADALCGSVVDAKQMQLTVVDAHRKWRVSELVAWRGSTQAGDAIDQLQFPSHGSSSDQLDAVEWRYGQVLDIRLGDEESVGLSKLLLRKSLHTVPEWVFSSSVLAFRSCTLGASSVDIGNSTPALSRSGSSVQRRQGGGPITRDVAKQHVRQLLDAAGVRGADTTAAALQRVSKLETEINALRNEIRFRDEQESSNVPASESVADDRFDCSVCMVNKCNIALVPCGHWLCSDCLPQLRSQTCPTCRTRIQSTIPVFMP